MSSSPWSVVTEAPPDAIFGLVNKFKADSNPDKQNVIIGAYRDDNGKPYVLPSVRKAEKVIFEAKLDHEYAGISGIQEFCDVAIEFAYGADSPAIKEDRVAAAQAISGTGALRLAMQLLKDNVVQGGAAKVYLSNPTWANHKNIVAQAGLQSEQYRYIDSKQGLDIDGMLEDLKAAPMGQIIMLHACAHNPTGVDPSPAQWKLVSEVIKARKHIVLFDSAYQGFASGDPAKDAFAMRFFVAEGHRVILCQSFSKNFGLYGERAGVTSVVTASPAEKVAVLSQLKKIIRPMYSNPPTFGARIVTTILSDPTLKAEWLADCKGMADRIISCRALLKSKLEALGSKRKWDHVVNQIGMFCFSGLAKEEVAKLQSDYSIYMTGNGRISMAGITSGNVGYIAGAIYAVTKDNDSKL